MPKTFQIGPNGATERQVDSITRELLAQRPERNRQPALLFHTKKRNEVFLRGATRSLLFGSVEVHHHPIIRDKIKQLLNEAGTVIVGTIRTKQ